MLRATGSTGFRNGMESLSFLSERSEDWQNLNWLLVMDDGPYERVGVVDEDAMDVSVAAVVGGGREAGLVAWDAAADAGGGVADFQKNGGRHDKSARP
jgi:hypothetical protein